VDGDRVVTTHNAFDHHSITARGPPLCQNAR